MFSEVSFAYIFQCVYCLKKAETRAEFAERTVAKLEKTIDDLEGTLSFSPHILPYTPSCNKSLTFCSDFSLFPISPSWPAHFFLSTSCVLLTLPFDLQMNCTLRSWNSRLSARSWIMPSMIWTPCKPCTLPTLHL